MSLALEQLRSLRDRLRQHAPQPVAVPPVMLPSPSTNRLLAGLGARLRASGVEVLPAAEPREDQPRRPDRRFRASTERGRLAAARLHEIDDQVIYEIEKWRPELVPVYHRYRVAVMRDAKRRRQGQARFYQQGTAASIFEAFQHYVHEHEEGIAAERFAGGDGEAAAYYERVARAEAEAAKRAARARGEEAPSEDFHVARVGRRKRPTTPTEVHAGGDDFHVVPPSASWADWPALDEAEGTR